jgi:glycosyltransferase involved in cell wall biosynthesis
MRILLFSTLYPNAGQPNHGVFVENRARKLAESGRVAVEVMAPVFVPPWPLSGLAQYEGAAQAPAFEVRHGLPVHHPRAWTIPNLGWRLNPRLLAAASYGPLLALRERFPFDLIDAHYFYPDGVAAMRLARAFDVPFICTARGSDVTYWPSRPAARRAILRVGEQAAGLAAVCDALAHEMTALGMPADKIKVLRNGVNLVHFAPQDRAAACARWGVEGSTLVSVGALIPRKAHHITIAAVAARPGLRLLIAGQGPLRAELQAQIDRLGVADRVRLLGPVAHADLPALYAAADLSVLTSRREGLANVILEAIACGTPVVATAVDGALEVLDDPRAGRLVPVDDAPALGAAIDALLASPLDRAGVRASAERFNWAETTAAQIAQFEAALTSHRRA